MTEKSSSSSSAPALHHGYTWEGAGVKLIGFTVAGSTSAYYLPDERVAIDVGQGLPFLLSAQHFFITHAHMDHCHGLSYLIAQKTMMNHATADCYLPAPLYAIFPKMMKLWEELEDHKYAYNLHESQLSSDFEIGKQKSIKVFRTTHRVPSVGYTLTQKKKKLKDQFCGLHPHEVAHLKKQGVELVDEVEESLISFTGDTTTAFWNQAPEFVKNSRVLAFDTTFVDNARSVEETQFWGHSHLKEMNEVLSDFHGQKLLLIHISARYSTEWVKKKIEEHIHPEFHHKIEIFPRPY